MRKKQTKIGKGQNTRICLTPKKQRLVKRLTKSKTVVQNKLYRANNKIMNLKS